MAEGAGARMKPTHDEIAGGRRGDGTGFRGEEEYDEGDRPEQIRLT